jgi:hypothetical protein
MTDRGFTLIEIVTALGIFIIGFVSVMSLFMGAYKAQEDGQSLLTLTLVAESIYTTVREPEVSGLRTVFENVAAPGVIGIDESADYPGYFYYITYDPYGTDPGNENCVYLTIHVFEQRYKKIFDVIYTEDYDDLDDDQKEVYNEHCLKFHTIIGDI